MTPRTWVITGATSIIAEHFAHLAAQEGHRLVLVGRQEEQLLLIAADIRLRYQIPCNVLIADLSESIDKLLVWLAHDKNELDLLIAHSDTTDNTQLTTQSITDLIHTNILTTSLLIYTYMSRQQTKHHLLYLSSVAACRGRAKNSLYGCSKAAIEVYLQGLQQAANKNQHLTIARLGFIDTRQTYGLPGIFYAGSAAACAKACWKAVKHHKRELYHPSFWKLIMAIIRRLPFVAYRRMGGV